MKRTNILLTVCLLFGVIRGLFAQEIKIKVDNVQPRIGQIIVITAESNVKKSKKVIQYFEQFLRLEVKNNPEIAAKLNLYSQSNRFVVKEIGLNTIGPFKFTFKGKEYFTNQITLDVIEPLGDRAGVWIRKIDMYGKEYILLEQIITFDPERVNENDTSNQVIDIDTTFVWLNQPNIEGLEFSMMRSGRAGTPNQLRTYAIESNYRYLYYEVRKDSRFKGPFYLQEKNFKNLPRGTKVPEIVIN